MALKFANLLEQGIRSKEQRNHKAKLQHYKKQNLRDTVSPLLTKRIINSPTHKTKISILHCITPL
mgnify:CR=1 FL=1